MDSQKPETSESTIMNSSKDGDNDSKNAELEERCSKLKAIALKLKKKVAEQTEELATFREEKSRLLEKTQNVSKIQAEFDKALDEIESLKKKEKVLQKDLKSAIDENVKLKQENIEQGSQIQTISHSHKFLRERVEALEKDAQNSSQWKEKATELERQLSQLKESAETVQSEKRQTNILSLEISDYVTKLDLAHSQLSDAKIQIESLTSYLEDKNRCISSLEEKLTAVKESEGQLQRTKESLEADLLRKSEKIAFLQEEISIVNERLQEKKEELTKLEQECESNKLAFSSQLKDLTEKVEGLKRHITTQDQKISLLEENKRNRESQISNLKLEIQQLDSEYNNYKQKAQSMLKASRPSDFTQETDEIENLQRLVQDFHSETSILKSNLQTLKLENENLSMEKAETQLKLNQVKAELLEKDVKFNTELQKIRLDSRQKDELLQTKMDNWKAEKEAITAAYKGQIKALKKQHDEELCTLKEQLEMLKVQEYDCHRLAESSPFAGAGPATSVLETSVNSLNISTKHTTSTLPDLDLGSTSIVDRKISVGASDNSYDQFRNIPRGECEGSESVGSIYTPRASAPNYNISFEQLLNSSFDSISKNSYDSDVEDKTFGGVNLKEELQRSQNLVSHLTGLLKESEANNERLSQLSEALKEEIRRTERENERKGHLKENTEYLKNILLKFITLSGEDERLRLVPVLKTMLRLTSEETSKLENAVKGKNFVADPTASWSSYLGMWSGGTK